jgi:hypothetical protein
MAQQPIGRPTIMTKVTVQKLEQALRDGFSIEMACYVSGVSRSTYYNHLASETAFLDKMTLAQSYATERAKQVVVQAIDKGDLKAAQWWLERKLRAEFSSNPSLQTQQANTPIVERYFRGDQDKFLGFMSQTIEALQRPENHHATPARTIGTQKA